MQENLQMTEAIGVDPRRGTGAQIPPNYYYYLLQNRTRIFFFFFFFTHLYSFLFGLSFCL